MKNLLLIFSLLPLFGWGQIRMNGYDSYWNEKLHRPDSVIYTAQPHIKVAKRRSAFHGKKALEADYKGSHLDIGHNASAEDMDGLNVTEYDSFNWVNTFPQVPNCNRITWLGLENYVRALNQPVRVKITSTGISKYLLPDSVAVPSVCIKEIWYSGRYERYEIVNADTCVRHPFTWYRVK